MIWLMKAGGVCFYFSLTHSVCRAAIQYWRWTAIFLSADLPVNFWNQVLKSRDTLTPLTSTLQHAYLQQLWTLFWTHNNPVLSIACLLYIKNPLIHVNGIFSHPLEPIPAWVCIAWLVRRFTLIPPTVAVLSYLILLHIFVLLCMPHWISHWWRDYNQQDGNCSLL